MNLKPKKKGKNDKTKFTLMHLFLVEDQLLEKKESH